MATTFHNSWFSLPSTGQPNLLLFYNGYKNYRKKAKIIFICCATPKKKAAQLTTAQRNIKAAEG